MPEVKPLAVKFYADKPGSYSNKFFCFGCSDYKQIAKILYRFKENGNKFRAVYITDYTKEKNYQLDEMTIMEWVWVGSEGKQERIYEGVPRETVREASKMISEVLRELRKT